MRPFEEYSIAPLNALEGVYHMYSIKKHVLGPIDHVEE